MQKKKETANAGSQLYSISESAGLLSVSAKTIRRLVDQRKLGSHVIGRQIRISDVQLEEYLTQTARPAIDATNCARKILEQ
jgi:excisionase family DNA binding protein